MRYSEVRQAAVELFKSSVATPIYLSGAPGLGKTSLMFDVAKDLGIPQEAVFIFRPSLHDPVDLMGVPHVDNGITRWASPRFLQEVNEAAEKYGTAVLAWDELPQAVIMMQNAIAGALLDRQIGEFKFHPRVVQMATGNRTIDKAGANRVVTQLANRVMHLEMEVHTDDWVQWALGVGLDPVDIAFIQYRPSHLMDFDPSRFSNATPRSWEKAFRIPKSIPQGIYHAMLSGLVTEGIAAEYIGFKRIADSVVSVAEILKNPTTAAVPEDPAALYAVCGALAAKASKDNFDTICIYLERMPPEFQTLCVKNSVRVNSNIGMTKAFIAWTTSHSNILI